MCLDLYPQLLVIPMGIANMNPCSRRWILTIFVAGVLSCFSSIMFLLLIISKLTLCWCELLKSTYSWVKFYYFKVGNAFQSRQCFVDIDNDRRRCTWAGWHFQIICRIIFWSPPGLAVLTKRKSWTKAWWLTFPPWGTMVIKCVQNGCQNTKESRLHTALL